MKILCPSCQQPIPGADIDLGSGRAVCRACAELVLLPSGASAAPLAVIEPSAPPALFRPSDLHLTERREGEAHVLELRANRLPQTLPALLPGGFFMLGFFSFVANILRGGGLVEHLPPLIIFGLFGALFLTVGGVMLLGKGVFRLSREGLEFRPAVRGRSIREPLENIVRFVDGQQTRQSVDRGGRYAVKVLTRDGRSVELRLDLASPEHARYVAAHLNRLLEGLREPRGYRG